MIFLITIRIWGEFALQLFEALFSAILKTCRQCLLLQVISLCSFLIQGLHDLRTRSWRIGRIWMDSNDSNDFSGAYEFGEKKDLYICKIDDIHIHDEEKSHSLQMHQLSAIKAAWVYRAWQFCSCLSLSSKSSCFSVCRLKCANDVDGSFRLARCPGDEPSVPKPSLSAPFASHDLGRSKFLDAKPILDRPQPAACRPFFLVLMCFCGLLCSHFPTCQNVLNHSLPLARSALPPGFESNRDDVSRSFTVQQIHLCVTWLG